MSRSRKKNPISGNTNAQSEKEDKRRANRQYRRKTKQEVILGNERLPHLREESNIWSFDKDGKKYSRNANPKELRK